MFTNTNLQEELERIQTQDQPVMQQKDPSYQPEDQNWLQECMDASEDLYLARS